MKLFLISVAIALVLNGTAKAQVNPVDEKREGTINWIMSFRSFATGRCDRAIRAPFGRYLLIQREEQILALKLEKHIPSKNKHGISRFSWVSFFVSKRIDSGIIEFEEGPGGDTLIRADGFEVEWSAGDWIYLNEEIKVARTEATEITELFSSDVVYPVEVPAKVGKLKWYSLKDLMRLWQKERREVGTKIEANKPALAKPLQLGKTSGIEKVRPSPVSIRCSQQRLAGL
ncbi:MAG: hypothetical protein ACI9R3_005494 [Verrucomicrobiales bacterium]|jgi:hypothetical protein